jgi:hypothetical protein
MKVNCSKCGRFAKFITDGLIGGNSFWYCENDGNGTGFQPSLKGHYREYKRAILTPKKGTK